MSNRTLQSRQILLAVILGVALSGCNTFRRQYSPLPAFQPPPTTLGAILPELEKRWPQLNSYQAQGDMAVSGEGVTGTVGFNSNLMYESPAQIRVRASRGPKTVLEVLQTGQVVSIIDSLDQKVYMGPVEQLIEHPGVIGGIEPLEIARALLIGQTFVNAVGVARAGGDDPATLNFEGDRLVFAQNLQMPGTTSVGRREEYVLRQRDGLIEGARLVQILPGERVVELIVDYNRWGVTGEGMAYPSEVVIESQNPRTRLKIQVDTVTVNYPFTPQAFYIDSGRYQMRGLNELLSPSAVQEA